MKMAGKRSVLVSVLEGPFLDLHKAGMPLPICIHLKYQGLSFGGSVWTAKQTRSGATKVLKK